MTKWRVQCGRVVSALVIVLASAGITGALVVGTALPAAANTCPTRTPEGDGYYSLTPAPSPGVDWSNCDLTNADLSAPADLTDANLVGAHLNGASAVSANFHGAQIEGADFSGADLTGADLSLVSLLSPAIFAGTNLRAVKFNADELQDEDFTNDNLSFADLTGASLFGAVITGANFNGVTWSNTICSDGSNSDSIGSCPGAEAMATSDGTSAMIASGGVSATVAGGTPGLDTLTASTYASNPGNNLGDGTIYFDVRLSPGNTFTSVTIQDCSHMYFPGNSPTMDWLPSSSAVYAPVQPTAQQRPSNPALGVNLQHCLQFTASSTSYDGSDPAHTTPDPIHGTTPDIDQLTGTVFAVALSPTVTCSKLSGSSTGTIIVSKCSPKSKTNKSGSFTGTSLTAGGSGTLTWKTSEQSSVFALADFGQLGQGACKTKSTEEDLSGTVTGGTSTYTRIGDPFAFHICVTKHHKVSLVKGTTASF